MNEYDKRYCFRMAKEEDINAIMCFIKTEWRDNHILGYDRNLFEYEFLEENGDVNFALAIDKEKETIEAITGFIKASHDSENCDTWGVMWKTKKGSPALLGLEVKKRRIAMCGCRTDMGVGDNPATSLRIFKKLMKRYTAKMNHYYILGDRVDYKIASINKRMERRCIDKAERDVVKMECITELNRYYDLDSKRNVIPYKDTGYFNHRYFCHILYCYEVYGIVDNNGLAEAIFVIKKEKIADREVIRMVDYLGDPSAITKIGGFFYELVDSNNCEYVDFYNIGIPVEHVKKAGFVKREEEDENIIPDYFHPFVRKNIDIWVDSTNPNTMFCKGDADQDRPN